jgi:hypothetical protein
VQVNFTSTSINTIMSLGSRVFGQTLVIDTGGHLASAHNIVQPTPVRHPARKIRSPEKQDAFSGIPRPSQLGYWRLCILRTCTICSNQQASSLPWYNVMLAQSAE